MIGDTKWLLQKCLCLNLRLPHRHSPHIPAPGIDSSNRDNALQVAEMSCNVTGEVALIVFRNITDSLDCLKSSNDTSWQAVFCEDVC